MSDQSGRVQSRRQWQEAHRRAVLRQRRTARVETVKTAGVILLALALGVFLAGCLSVAVLG